MGTLKIVREENPEGTVTLRLEGTLNGEAAQTLAEKLREVGAKEVVIDFSHLREFLDVAVPAVLRAIEAKPCHLQGLMRHQVRMFRYFGHMTPQALEREFWVPEERVLM